MFSKMRKNARSSTQPPKGVTMPVDKNGKPNPKYVDLLTEDRPIAGQKFACVSFVSPENIIRDRNVYLFSEFVKNWGFSKPIEAYNGFLNFLAYKYELKLEDLTNDLKSFIDDQKEKLVETSIRDDYKTFLDAKEEELMTKFGEEVQFQTAVRGIKIRGSFPTQQEAELRCKLLRESDPDHDVYVGPVGMWMPWEPEAYKTGRVEYLEPELNQLMDQKNKNEASAREAFEQRVAQTKKDAIEENIRKAKESGNKLSQNIDSDGNLIGVAGMSTVEESLSKDGAAVAAADIQKELFEGDNIVMKPRNSKK